jgi:hypothetical protein
MDEQIKALATLSANQRFDAIKAQIKRAMDLHAQIQEMPLDLDPHGNGEHLEGWLDAINRFYRRFLKA